MLSNSATQVARTIKCDRLESVLDKSIGNITLRLAVIAFFTNIHYSRLCYQFSVPQIEYPLGQPQIGSHIYFLLIIVIVILL